MPHPFAHPTSVRSAPPPSRAGQPPVTPRTPRTARAADRSGIPRLPRSVNNTPYTAHRAGCHAHGLVSMRRPTPGRHHPPGRCRLAAADSRGPHAAGFAVHPATRMPAPPHDDSPGQPDVDLPIPASGRLGFSGNLQHPLILQGNPSPMQRRSWGSIGRPTAAAIRRGGATEWRRPCNPAGMNRQAGRRVGKVNMPTDRGTWTRPRRTGRGVCL